MQKLGFLSLITVPIKVIAATGAELGPATGFFYGRDRDWIYLVTNWHVVTGRNPFCPQKTRYGSIPIRIDMTLHKKMSEKEISLSNKITHQVRINNEDGSDPSWFEHPIFRQMVDVVMGKIPNDTTFTEDAFFNCLQEYGNFAENFLPKPMDDIFVIGYPWGLTGGDAVLPLYKRGSVASEPIVGHAHLPRFLIDCRTAEGMSGSPVICAHSGVWDPNGPMGSLPDGQMGPQTIIGTIENFAGVYSGRLITQEKDLKDQVSDIGVVWKKTAVDEIISNGVQGTKLHDLLS